MDETGPIFTDRMEGPRPGGPHPDDTEQFFTGLVEEPRPDADTQQDTQHAQVHAHPDHAHAEHAHHDDSGHGGEYVPKHGGSPSKVGRLARLGSGFLNRIPTLSAAIMGGLLLVVSFPPFGYWFAAIGAFALLAWALKHESTRPVGGFGYGWLFGAAFYVPLLPWTGELVGAFPWLGLSAFCALYPALFGVSAVLVRRLPGWPIWFAAMWVAQEWIKSTVPWGGFPWGVAAYGQTDGPMLSIVRYGGVSLLSFAVALCGFSAGALVLELIGWWRRDHATRRNGGERSSSPPLILLPAFCICAVLIATALAWPEVRKSGSGADGAEATVNVAIVQGNVPRLGLDFNAQRRAVLDYHVNETKKLAEDVRAGKAPKPAFVVWPENSSDIDPLRNPDAAAQISAAADDIGAPILVGAVLVGPGATADNPVSTNTVLVWNPGTGPADRHDKQIIQPFGEYLPWRSLFKRLSPYADKAGYFVPIDGDGVVRAGDIKIGVTTCWEVIFDRASRESVLNGAQVLAVPSNNALFGKAMSEQQLAFAKVRAVEHDRYTLVAGTTGISALIAPDGHEIARTEFFEPAYIVKAIHPRTDLTPATRWAPLVQWVLIGIAGAALLAAILHNVLSARRRASAADTPSVTPAEMKERDDDVSGADSGAGERRLGERHWAGEH